VLFVGHQAAGTRGQLLAHGATTVRVFGEVLDVRCRVEHIESLSAHADADELMAWISRSPRPPKTVYIVHGEPPAAESLCNRIESELGWSVDIALHGETAHLS
jgi:metallo-beta-lactamase family protein